MVMKLIKYSIRYISLHLTHTLKCCEINVNKQRPKNIFNCVLPCLNAVLYNLLKGNVGIVRRPSCEKNYVFFSHRKSSLLEQLLHNYILLVLPACITGPGACCW